MNKSTRNKVKNGLWLAVGALLLLAPSIAPSFAVPAVAGPGSVITVRGIWELPNFAASSLVNQSIYQYEASYGSGPFTGGITGNSTAALLLQINNDTSVVTFTGQIFCVCKIAGRTGPLWISLTNGVDVNFSNPNGKTTGDLTVINSKGGLSGITGSGKFVTTTSSDEMNYTMTIRFP
jgi:hypothetical protein